MPFDATDAVAGSSDGEGLLSFASNDYLGLTRHPAVIDAAHAALDRWGTGSGSSRYVVGSRPVHHELEDALASWRGCRTAMVTPTGYAANLAAITTLAGRGTRICSDELNHASIVDACRLARASGAELVITPHGDPSAVEQALADAPGRSMVVSDLVFSMDGDAADVDALQAACARHDALLVLDVAHAVLGPAIPEDPPGSTTVQVGTLSKALGTVGGFVAGPAGLVEVIVQRARSAIFSTAMAPADAAAALTAVAIVSSPEGAALRRRLRSHVDRLDATSPSPIIPVVYGPESDPWGSWSQPSVRPPCPKDRRACA
jgi:7-keto-8-aminopelargonate synthetase-like enzyme